MIHTTQTWNIMDGIISDQVMPEMDGMELLDDLEKDSVTLMILDLPYYGVVDAAWDNQWKTLDDYLDWCKEWFIKSIRVLKDNGSLYYFNSQYNVLNAVDYVITSKTSLLLRQHITIDKGWQSACSYHGVSDGIRSYPTGTEFVNWYTFQDKSGLTTVTHDVNLFKSLRQYFKEFQKALDLSIHGINDLFGNRNAEHAFYWNSTQWLLPTEDTYKKLCGLPIKYEFTIREYESLRSEYESLRSEYESLRYPFNHQDNSYDVWHFNFYKERRHGHPTQKPFDLIKRSVLTSSNEGDMVCDPTMGTGTTMKVCEAYARNFIGAEIDQDYESVIKDRCMTHTPSLMSYF